MTVPKTPTKLVMRLSPEEQRIITEIRAEQHANLIASGALLGPPTTPDIVRSLIAREGARLALGKASEAVGKVADDVMASLTTTERELAEQRMNRSVGAPSPAPPFATPQPFSPPDVPSIMPTRAMLDYAKGEMKDILRAFGFRAGVGLRHDGLVVRCYDAEHGADIPSFIGTPEGPVSVTVEVTEIASAFEEVGAP